MKTNKSEWKGLTLEQLETRRMVTKLKIEMLKESMIARFNIKGEGLPSDKYFSHATSIIDWVTNITRLVNKIKQLREVFAKKR